MPLLRSAPLLLPLLLCGLVAPVPACPGDGDLDGNGVVELMDLQAAVLTALGLRPMVDEADLNADGIVNLLDLQTYVQVLLLARPTPRCSPAWAPLAAGGTRPASRVGARAILDPGSGRMLLVAGRTGSSWTSEVWALDLQAGSETWSLLSPAGSAFPARAFPVVVHDAVRSRLLVFGGEDAQGPRADVWAFDLTGGGNGGWSELQPQTIGYGSPPPTTRHAAVFDAGRDRMMAFGGQIPGMVSGDTWSLYFSGTGDPNGTWRRYGWYASSPAKRFGHTMVIEPATEQAIVFGGEDGSTVFQDVWTANLPGCT